MFTVDAMAPMIWQGLVALPEDAAEGLRSSLDEEPLVTLGKSTIVGLGQVQIQA